MLSFGHFRNIPSLLFHTLKAVICLENEFDDQDDTDVCLILSGIENSEICK
jgi:hypothetical protein